MFATNKISMGNFSVYLNDDLRSNKVLFHKSGSQEVNDWMEVKVNFIPVGKYKVSTGLSIYIICVE